MADDTPGARPASDDVARHPSPEELRDHLENRLGATDAGRVQTHLEDCDACLASLEVLEPPIEELASPAGPPAGSGAGPPAGSGAVPEAGSGAVPEAGSGAVPEAGSSGEPDAWDARRTRRAVRRTVLRTALDAIGIVVIVLIGGNLLAWAVWHPLAIDRGDRIVEHVTAAIDLPMLTIPGVEVSGYNSDISFLRRITEVQAERALGPTAVDLGSYSLRLGPFGTTSAPGDPPIAPFGPPLQGGFLDLTQVPFDADRLGPGTAVTAYLLWETPVGIEDADALTGLAEDLALLWVGFEQPDHAGNEFVDPWGQLGYSACLEVPDDLGDPGLGGSGFGSSGGLRMFGIPQETGAAHALTQVRRATANPALADLVENQRGGPDGVLTDLPATAAWYADNDPGVTSVVLTGPTASVAEVVAATSPTTSVLLEVDFDRGAPEPCG